MNKKFLLVMSFLFIICFTVWCNQAPDKINNLNYAEIINKQFSHPNQGLIVDEILWHKVINDQEVVLYFLNRENTVSVGRIAYVNNKWRAFVSAPPKKLGKTISWKYSLLANPPAEENPEIASIFWGYIYEPEVAKVVVGTENKQQSYKEATVKNFPQYNIKLYYLFSSDKSGFENDNVIAFDKHGNILFNSKP